jgi:hypothetical protein
MRTGGRTGALLSLAKSYLWGQTRALHGGLEELPEALVGLRQAAMKQRLSLSSQYNS